MIFKGVCLLLELLKVILALFDEIVYTLLALLKVPVVTLMVFPLLYLLNLVHDLLNKFVYFSG